MEYEKSTQPYISEPVHFEWKIIHNFSKLGVITLLICQETIKTILAKNTIFNSQKTRKIFIFLVLL